jgi:hypothetical protein
LIDSAWTAPLAALPFRTNSGSLARAPPPRDRRPRKNLGKIFSGRPARRPPRLARGWPGRSVASRKRWAHREGAMSIDRAIAIKRINLLDVFIERAEARAYLWSIGELTLHEAVDVLQADAERDGLIERVGADTLQQILSDAFRPEPRGWP